MPHEMMNLEQLAVYLKRDLREVTKMANRGYLPGHKVGGQWRFARAEINHWLETQMHSYTEQELTALETQEASEPLVAGLLSVQCIGVPLAASTKASVLKELVRLAECSWEVYDAEALHEAICRREELLSTALGSGVAIPHPRRPMPAALGQAVIAYGRTTSGIPFGDPGGGLTDVFFLVCSRDDRTHLSVLARLSRLFLRPGFLDQLRDAQTPEDSWNVIEAAERELVESSEAPKK